METSQTQTHLQSLYLNNIGASLIRKGDYSNAIAYLCEGIAVMKVVLREQKGQQCRCKQVDMEVDNCDDENENVHEWFTNCMMTQEKSSSSSYSSSAPLTEDSFGYICQHPISIPNDSTQPIRINSIVAMYNLALSHHLYALNANGNGQQHEEIDDEYLQKAGTLYELCYEMLQVEDIDAGPFFMMALANNIGQIHAVRGAEDRAALFFEHLLSTQMFLVDCGDVEQYATTSIMDGYWRNTSRLVLSACSAAAA